ncbi:MAG TPA: ComF family protein [Rubrivivax sp.]
MVSRRWLQAARPASQCEVCRNWNDERLCADCRARHAPARIRCRRCALPVAAGVSACGACLRQPPNFRRAVCAVDYGFPWDRLVLDLKFNGLVELAAPLAQLLVQALRDADGASGVDAVLPVPLGPKRLAERGYNQAWELARRVARALALPAGAHALERPVDSAHQADLPRDMRAANLRGAFMVAPRQRDRVAGRHLALVDDVMTTGATAREASAALLRAGAASVVFWAVARTP